MIYQAKKPYHYGTGRRKSSVARVRLYEGGTGKITINDRDIDDYFGLETLKLLVRQPLEATNLIGACDVVATVQGGGVTGQAGESAAHRQRRISSDFETGGLAHPRPENEGTQEVRSQSRSSCAAVLQTLNFHRLLCAFPAESSAGKAPLVSGK